MNNIQTFLGFGLETPKWLVFTRILTAHQLADKRREQAQLLGYKSYADWTLRYKIAATPEKVNDFLNKIDEKVKHVEQAELNETQSIQNRGSTPNL